MIGATLRGVGNALIFVSGLAVSCVALGLALPLPEVPQVKEKLEWFRAHRDDYTALFIGTSRVRRHIIPSLFDRLASEQGVAMRSFNLGVDSLAAPEDAYVLDQALRAAPPRLRYVFIELSFFRAAFEGQAPDSIRATYWHDWERSRIIWRKLLQEDYAEIKPLKKRKKKRWESWLLRSANVSDGSSLMGGFSSAAPRISAAGRSGSRCRSVLARHTTAWRRSVPTAMASSPLTGCSAPS